MLEVPFLPEFRSRLLDDSKTATSRTKRLGRVGQRFTAFGGVFQFTSIKKIPLRWVRDLYYLDEGFDDPAAFVKVWNRIHPRRGFVETDRVWFHVFERVP